MTVTTTRPSGATAQGSEPIFTGPENVPALSESFRSVNIEGAVFGDVDLPESNAVGVDESAAIAG